MKFREGVDWLHEDQGFCEHGNEPSSSVKGGKFLDWLSVC